MRTGTKVRENQRKTVSVVIWKNVWRQTDRQTDRYKWVVLSATLFAASSCGANKSCRSYYTRWSIKMWQFSVDSKLFSILLYVSSTWRLLGKVKVTRFYGPPCILKRAALPFDDNTVLVTHNNKKLQSLLSKLNCHVFMDHRVQSSASSQHFCANYKLILLFDKEITNSAGNSQRHNKLNIVISTFATDVTAFRSSPRVSCNTSTTFSNSDTIRFQQTVNSARNQS